MTKAQKYLNQLNQLTPLEWDTETDTALADRLEIPLSMFKTAKRGCDCKRGTSALIIDALQYTSKQDIDLVGHDYAAQDVGCTPEALSVYLERRREYNFLANGSPRDEVTNAVYAS